MALLEAATTKVYEEHSIFPGRKFFVALYHDVTEKQALKLSEIYFPAVGNKRNIDENEKEEPVAAPEVKCVVVNVEHK